MIVKVFIIRLLLLLLINNNNNNNKLDVYYNLYKRSISNGEQ